tara:strand:+ start:470 stop:652 length:183 start_codon:yes stop_codon:yes gene_type:complete
MKKGTDYAKYTWHSLSQLKRYIELNNPKEKIKSYEGYELVTSKAKYRLYMGELRIYPKKD